jgi:hypothetical protein
MEHDIARFNMDFLPPMVAMHAPCATGLQDHAIFSARDEESMSFACYNGKGISVCSNACMVVLLGYGDRSLGVAMSQGCFAQPHGACMDGNFLLD